MAKAAKKAAAKSASKSASKTTKQKPEKKAPPAKSAKKEAAKKPSAPAKEKPKKAAPVIEVEAEETEEVSAPAPQAEKPAKKEKVPRAERLAKAAADKANADDLKKWSDYKDKFGHEKALPYNMSQAYEGPAPIQHKVLGWGYIVSIQNDRLEVLFESGSKTLISNYKPR